MMEFTVGIGRAAELAEQTGLVSLQKSVAAAAEEGWDILTFKAAPDGDGGYDIGVVEPTGLMVAWFLPDWIAQDIAIPGEEPASELHVTLAYMGDAVNLSLDDQRKLIGVVGEVCLNHQELDGDLEGTGRFVNGDPEDAWWVGVNIPGLDSLRADLVAALQGAGFQLAGFHQDGTTFQPHVTVAYIPKDQASPPLDFKPVDVSLRHLTVCVGAKRFELKLQIPDSNDGEMAEPSQRGWVAAMTKAVETVEEDRFTLAPWYVPEALDAHGEWTDTHELEKSFHGYLAKPDRDIRLQHNTDIVAGHWVSGMVVPTPWTVQLRKADGTTEDHTYPAGTPFLGVEWKPWAFELVKKGLIRGYSIGGTSERMYVDLPDTGAPKP